MRKDAGGTTRTLFFNGRWRAVGGQKQLMLLSIKGILSDLSLWPQCKTKARVSTCLLGCKRYKKTVGTSQQQQRSSKNPFCILIFQLRLLLIFFQYLTMYLEFSTWVGSEKKLYHLLRPIVLSYDIRRYFQIIEAISSREGSAWRTREDLIIINRSVLYEE